MYKLIRFYNQNRKKILKTILIIVFIIGGIQLLNYFSKTNTNSNYGNTEQNSNKNKIAQELISDKSPISGQSISSSKLKNDTEIIKDFIEKCNNKDINSAYELLTEECKELMFPTVQDFYNIYYMNIFNEESRIYTLENWYTNTYQVKFSEDILSIGKLDGDGTKQDYITIISENGQNKLNINSYIEREKSNKKTERKNIEITITSIDKYIDYEIYNLSIKNNSESTILLDTNDDVNSIYLVDKNNIKYYFYNNEIIENKLLIENQFTKKLQIKFNNSYSSSKKIKNLIFSKLVLDYEEYLNLEDKMNFEEFYEFRVDI